MKRLISVLLMSLMLSGCFLSNTNTVTETVYREVYPPMSLMQSCEPPRPDDATVQDVILTQSRAIDQCNDQLESIRDWKARQTKSKSD